MNDEEPDPEVVAEFKKLIDDYYFGPDQPQDGMTFNPGDTVRIIRATGAIDPVAWEGLLCRVIKSYRANSMGSTEVLEICVLVPLEPRPDTHGAGEEEWMTWRADLLAKA